MILIILVLIVGSVLAHRIERKSTLYHLTHAQRVAALKLAWLADVQIESVDPVNKRIVLRRK